MQSVPNMDNGLREARTILKTYSDDSLDMGQLAYHAGFSRYHFIRIFRQAFGMTPYQYLIQQRIEKAKTLLMDAQLSVTDVCMAVGFRSLGSFSVLFRKTVGLSPREYREHTAFMRCSEYRPGIPMCFRMKHGLPSED